MPINITVPFERLADDIEQEVDRKYRAFWFTLYNNVNLLSPVLTGRYRSSHIMSVGQPSSATVGVGFVTPPNFLSRLCGGEVGSDSTIINYSGRGVFGGYSEFEVDNESIMANDVKLTALQSEVTTRPQLDDVINGYQVVAVNQDPASVTYKIQLRKV